jgi:hypothetical protein
VTANLYGLRLLRKPRTQRLVVVVILAVVLLARLAQFAYWTGQLQWGYDFSAYWTAADHLLHGQSIYLPDQLAGPYAPQRQFLYLYPPAFAAAAIPFAALFSDYRFAEWVWTAIGAAIVLWVSLALHRSERVGECYKLLASRGRWLVVAAAFAFPPIVAELVLGNVNILLLGLFTAAWLGIRHGNESDDGRATAASGIAIGLATVIKLFPGVLLLWLLLTRRYRAAAWAVVAAAVFVVVTLPITGFQPWRDYPTVLANLSAPSDATDTLAPTVWLAPYLGFTLARLLVMAAGLAILAFTARSASTAVSFAIAVLVSVLIAPALYQHYLAIVVLPMLLALGAGIRLRWIGLAYLLMSGGQQDALGEFAWIVNKGLPTAGVLLLLGLLLAQLRNEESRRGEGPEDRLEPGERDHQHPASAVAREQ